MNKEIITGDLGRAFETLKSEMFYRYRGAMATRQFGGYVWSLGFYSSKELFQEAVDRTYGVIENSIKK